MIGVLPLESGNRCRKGALVGFLLGIVSTAMVGAQDGLLITEFMAHNTATLADADGEYSDWVEILNAGSEAIDLAGYHLSDRATNLTKWEFPSVVVQPGSFLVVFCSGKDFRDPSQELHTNFEINDGGELLVLSDPSGVPISLFDFPEQVPDVSYGISTDSRVWHAGGVDVPVRVHVPTDDTLGLDWTAPDFDDASWREGTSVVGFGARGDDEALIGTDVEADMDGINASIYIRMSFDLDDFSEADLFELAVRYDDGFVAWLNGVEIARDNVPEAVLWNSEAERSHSATRPEVFDVAAHSSLLRPGRNVLAFQALNSSPTGSDLFFLPELEIVDVGEIREDVLQYFETATPGRPNLVGYSAITPDPIFSHPGGAVVGGVSLELSTELAGAVVRYTLDGSRPDASSTLYTEPIAIDGSTVVTARVFKDGLAPGRSIANMYLPIDSRLETFSSNLPLVVCTTFGRAIGGNCGGGPYTPGHVVLLDPAGDRAHLLDEPAVSHAAGFRKRGSSTCGRPKFSFNIEFWGDGQIDESVPVLDFPVDSDYVMYGPYNFDRALMRNPIAYWMSREVGPWAARTRFVECYFHSGRGPMSSTSYMGVYVLMEKNKRHPDKIDVEQLTSRDNAPPEVEGGYILKRDRIGQDEVATSAGGYGSLVFVYPKQPTPAQRSYITNYINQAISSLSPNIGAQEDSELIDVREWLDHHILNWYPKNVDAFRLSGYFHKTRQGPLVMGPVWDYDRTMGCADDDRARDPTGFNNTAVGDGGTLYFGAGGLGSWYSILFQNRPPTGNDPWARAYRARWRELRRGPLRTDRILAQIDAWAEELDEAADRNFQKWPAVRPRFGSFEGEVNHLKDWLAQRADWIDSQFIATPVFSREGGIVDEGTQVEISVESGSPIWYTIDGSDPRGAGNEASETATLYTGPITITTNMVIRARAFEGDGVWSGVSEVGFVTYVPRLTVTEIMYSPADDTPDEDPTSSFTRSDYEFLELKNVDTRDVSLVGLSFSRGVTFDFTDSRVSTLRPGELLLIVSDEAAFAARYGSTEGLKIAGEYRGTLSDGGETIHLVGLLGETIFDFEYSGDWYPETDGTGPSLVNVDSSAPFEALNEAASWQASAEPFGNPGIDSSSPEEGLQRPGDLNQDGRLNVTDAVGVLRHLFGGASVLPCGAELGAPGNVALLDGNGDGGVDIADVVHVLRYVFQEGPAHALGVSCVRIAGCPDACAE